MLAEAPRPQIPGSQPGSIYIPEPARVLRVQPMTDLDTLFDLELSSGRQLDHAPGQFMQVSILGVGECPISICSSPTRPEMFQFSVRRVGEVTRFIHQLEPGEVIGVRGPLGHGFEVNELHGHDIVIVAGGCALAPARSLIQYILDRRDRFGRFHLLYGGRSPKELVFRDELAGWQASDAIDCHITVDHPDEDWHGPTGLVTRLFDTIPRLDAQRTIAAVIGPPLMFKFVTIELLSRGIRQDRLYCSLERRMKCGIGKCGHCQINHSYACIDGPVFKYSGVLDMPEAVE